LALSSEKNKQSVMCEMAAGDKRASFRAIEIRIVSNYLESLLADFSCAFRRWITTGHYRSLCGSQTQGASGLEQQWSLQTVDSGKGLDGDFENLTPRGAQR
jgi:hypothetical protein